MSRRQLRANAALKRRIAKRANVSVKEKTPQEQRYARMIHELATKLQEHGPLKLSVGKEMAALLEVGWLFHVSKVNQETGEFELLSAIAPK